LQKARSRGPFLVPVRSEFRWTGAGPMAADRYNASSMRKAPVGRFWCAVALVVLVGFAAPGCLVVSLNRYADDATVTFDAKLLGTWRDADDAVSVTIERSDWQSYRLSYTHPITSGQLTGYLFRSGSSNYIDLMPVRGEDPGVFTIAGHVLVRIAFEGSQLTVAPLAYDRLLRALEGGTAPADLGLVRNERDQLVATTDSARLHRWLQEQANDAAFGAAATFQKEP
jgi:hypothetical protein